MTWERERTAGKLEKISEISLRERIWVGGRGEVESWGANGSTAVVRPRMGDVRGGPYESARAGARRPPVSEGGRAWSRGR